MKRFRLPPVSLVIPLYNNERTAWRQLNVCYRLLRKMPIKFEILLCNDGSVDNTLGIIKKFSISHANVRIINHTRNSGIAGSLKDLYGRARNKYTMLFSADGEWNPEDLPRLIYCLVRNHLDIVIGRRLAKQYNLGRRIVSFFYNYLPLILFGVQTYDVGSIKIFRTDLFQKQKFISQSVFFEAEMLIKAKRIGSTIGAVDISHNPKLSHTKSGVNLKAVTSAFKDVIRLKIHQ